MVRIKHRYLLIEILYPEGPARAISTVPDTVLFHAPSPDYLTPGLFVRVVRDKIAELYGDYGAGVVGNGLAVKYLSPATSVCILRCPRSAYRLVWSAVTYLTSLPRPSSGRGKMGRGPPFHEETLPQETNCVCRVVRVSGTIRKAEEEAVRRARRAVINLKEGAEGDLMDRLGLSSAGGIGATIEDDDDAEGDLESE